MENIELYELIATATSCNVELLIERLRYRFVANINYGCLGGPSFTGEIKKRS